LDLHAELKRFDGKHVDRLESLVDEMVPDAATTRRLCELVRDGDGPVPIGASWILKRLQEEGREYEARVVGRLLTALLRAEHWATRLHLLQMLPGA
jgi:hypothetical protein